MKHLSWSFWHEYNIWELFLFSLNSFLSNGAEAESLNIEIRKCEDEGLVGFQVHSENEMNENKVAGNQDCFYRLCRCGGRNIGEQFILSLNIFTIKLSEIC